ncbi:alpha/beta hydrolase family protein [Tautonia plasticadhaerens]|uniref:Alpha/beta hydrolase family protein n=1 Tax=Tautonia plasticadhaerens TaxID=2527974 RepID=A0A518GW69_9BACT|nr:prolyl oligopeptidase family serine peptidase [Tautonia plasticadhaerens]QDV32791.1 Alpha/beta hydrolase family protein [Tautonia plasticadhaerens]
MEPNMLGAYGPWAASLLGEGPARLSFRNPDFAPAGLEPWRLGTRRRVAELMMEPDAGGVPRAEIQHRFEYDGLDVEHLHWELPYGPPTEAVVLKPAGATGRLPAVLALHDHGGNKYFGWKKVAQIGDELHPIMRAHRDEYYGGLSWANELARRGFVVLVHDAFAFASRRIRLADVPERIRDGLEEVRPESEEEIRAYNRFAGQHESIMAKSLFCAGTTWPGVFLAEDRRALAYLASREDVDPDRIGCGGLSGGGLRTVYLAGTDDRIACACCVGMMSTWRDYALDKSFTHTWMIYIPGLPPDLDYPEILGLRVPRPTLVQYDEEDSLFTLPEMKRADTMLAEVFDKAGSGDRYRGTFYPGPHKFDRPMQDEAFGWFDRWIGG